MRVFLQVEELGLAHRAVDDVVLDQFPVALADRAHARLGAAAVDSVQDLARGVLLAHEDRFETDSLTSGGWLESGQVAEGGHDVEQVDVAQGPRSGLDPGTLGEERHPPGVLVQVLLPLQPVPADRHAVIGGVKDIGIVELTHGLKFLQHPGHLMIDVLGAGQLAADLVSNRHLVATLPYPADLDFVAQTGMAVVKGMLRQPIERQLRSLRVGRGQGVLVTMVHRPVLFKQLRSTITHVMRMRKAEVDEERILVLGLFPVVQVVHHLLPVPVAAGLLGAAALGGVVTHRELGIGGAVTVSVLAGPHGVVARLVEDRGQTILDRVRDTGLFLLFLVLFVAASLQVPDGAARHDHFA